MFSSKKGDMALEESQQNLLSLLFALGIFIGIISFIFAIKSGTVFERHFHVKEMALLVDAVTISPGTIEVDYPKDMKDLGLIFEKEKITVYKLPKFISPPEHYPFSEDKNVIYEYTEIEPPGKGTIRPKVSKAGNVLKVTGEEYVPDAVTKPACTDVPGRESLRTKPVFVEAIIEVIEKPELLEEKELIDKAKAADVAVVIIPADEPDELINPVNAYVSINSGRLEESFYLSCLIINKILENENLKKIMADNGISEFNFQSTTPTDQYHLLESNNIGVVLEVWNSNSPAYQSAANQNTAFNDMVEGVKKSVNEAIDAYG